MKIKNSEITLKYVDKVLDSFAPIRIYYNKVLVYDDMMDADDEEDMLAEYKFFIERNRDKHIYKIKVRIKEFHHSYVWITGDKAK